MSSSLSTILSFALISTALYLGAKLIIRLRTIITNAATNIVFLINSPGLIRDLTIYKY